ncbi:MAG: aspartate/glutamate racemase family protein [Pseudomonadota bacterium]
MGITRAVSRKQRHAYGLGLGVLLLDEVYPGFPGDVRNASGFPYPIQYEIVEGVDIQALVYQEDKSPCLEPIKRAAQRLERLGCRAIAAECGYFSYFQKDIAAGVDIPVFMSSLLQAPWARQLIGPSKVVGILMSCREALREEHLVNVGARLEDGYVIGGVMDNGNCPELHRLWTEGVRPAVPQAVYEKAEREFIGQAVKFFAAHPNMGAMVLECTGFPPFARALQREIDIPVFSWGTLFDFAYSVVAHRDYYGHI